MLKRVLKWIASVLGFANKPSVVSPYWALLLKEAKKPQRPQQLPAKMSFLQALTTYWREAGTLPGSVGDGDYQRALDVLGPVLCEYLRIRVLLGKRIIWYEKTEDAAAFERELRWRAATDVPTWLDAVLAGFVVTVPAGITAALVWRAARAQGLKEPQAIPARAGAGRPEEMQMHILQKDTRYPVVLRVTVRGDMGPIEVDGGGTIHRGTLKNSKWEFNGTWLEGGPQGRKSRPGNDAGNPVAPPAQPKP